MRVEVNGRAYSVKQFRGSHLIHVRGPLHFKRPHRGIYSTKFEEWRDSPGTASYEGHIGPRTTRFYQDANEAVAIFRGETAPGNRMGVTCLDCPTGVWLAPEEGPTEPGWVEADLGHVSGWLCPRCARTRQLEEG